MSLSIFFYKENINIILNIQGIRVQKQSETFLVHYAENHRTDKAQLPAEIVAGRGDLSCSCCPGPLLAKFHLCQTCK